MCYKVFLLLTALSLCESWCFLATAFEGLVLPCGGGDCFLSVFSQTSCQDISLYWLSGAFGFQLRADGKGGRTGGRANLSSAGKGSLRCSAWTQRGKRWTKDKWELHTVDTRDGMEVGRWPDGWGRFGAQDGPYEASLTLVFNLFFQSFLKQSFW